MGLALQIRYVSYFWVVPRLQLLLGEYLFDVQRAVHRNIFLQ